MCVQVKEEISNRRSYGNTVVGGDTGVVLCLCGGDTVAIFLFDSRVCLFWYRWRTEGATAPERTAAMHFRCVFVALLRCVVVAARAVALHRFFCAFRCFYVHVLGFCFASAASKWRISQGPEFGAGPEKIIGVS